MKYRTITKIIGFGVIVFTFYFMGWYIYSNWDEISAFHWDVDYLKLFGSLSLLTLSSMMLAFGWYVILRILNTIVNPVQSMRIYMASQLARYIPGKIFMFIGRIIMAEQMGVTKTLSSISILFEALFSTSGAFLAMLILYSLSSRIEINWLNPLKTAIILALVLIFLNPKLIRHVVNKTYRISNKRDPDVPLPQLKFYKITLLCSYYILMWVLIGLSFYFLVESLIGNLVNSTLIFDLSCIFLLAWLVGFLSYVTPGGIGVREAALALSLKAFIPLYFVSIIALVSRLWFLLGEILGLIIIYVIPKNVGKSGS